jgi:hypothetical protein
MGATGRRRGVACGKDTPKLIYINFAMFQNKRTRGASSAFLFSFHHRREGRKIALFGGFSFWGYNCTPETENGAQRAKISAGTATAHATRNETRRTAQK